jgi:hypothetical protein
MKTLKTILRNPSGWDSFENYMGEIPADDWLCVLTRSRESDLLTESNFDTALEMLGGKGENVEIHRFGHWACGWWESLAVRAGTPQATIAEEIEKKIESYPVLDEEDFSRREDEAAQDVWRDYRVKDRVKYIRENRSQFDFHGFADLRAVIRGDYFTGHVSWLL